MRFYFTFCGDDYEHRDYVQPIDADNYIKARQIMFKKYGEHWGFQYDEDQWNKWCNERPSYYRPEIELPILVQQDQEDKS